MKMNISEFKKGDIITRVELIEEKIADKELIGQSWFIGIPYQFINISNNCIYLYRIGEINFNICEMNFLPLKIWENGWGYYKNPDENLKEKIKEKIKNLLEIEDYENVDKLNKLINK